MVASKKSSTQHYNEEYRRNMGKNLNRTISMFLEKLLYLGYFNSNCRETLCVFSSHIPLYNAIFVALKFENFFFIDFFDKRYNKLAIHSYIYTAAPKIVRTGVTSIFLFLVQHYELSLW
jgi:hypothetical protein